MFRSVFGCIKIPPLNQSVLSSSSLRTASLDSVGAPFTVNLSPNSPVPSTFRLPSVASLELLFICVVPFIVVVPVILVDLLIVTISLSAVKTEVSPGFTSKVLFIITGAFAVMPSEFAVSLSIATLNSGVLILVFAFKVSVVKLVLIGTPALFSILFALIGSIALAFSCKA